MGLKGNHLERELKMAIVGVGYLMSTGMKMSAHLEYLDERVSRADSKSKNLSPSKNLINYYRGKRNETHVPIE